MREMDVRDVLSGVGSLVELSTDGIRSNKRVQHVTVREDIKLCYYRQIRNAWKVLKCFAREGWRRPVGPIM